MLPVLRSDLISSKVAIPDTLSFPEIIDEIVERHQYKRVIQLHSAFADEVQLSYPGVTVDLERDTQSFSLRMYHP